MKHLPLMHISLRVPWHDSEWDGTVCKEPDCNASCLRLPRISEDRNDEDEIKYAGKKIMDLPVDKRPVCTKEKGFFMAPFSFDTVMKHPYQKSSTDTHGHLRDTDFRYPAFSAAAVPYRWMLKQNMEEFINNYGLKIDPGKEPEIDFMKTWVQDGQNQEELLETFFGHIKPQNSLCLFYVKQAPMIEDPVRIVVGVGRVNKIGQIQHYESVTKNKNIPAIWDRIIEHSIRPEFSDGFLMPYHQMVERMNCDQDFDPSEFTVIVSPEHFIDFSYGSNHVTNDAAIAVLSDCASVLMKCKGKFNGPWDDCVNWINNVLTEIWKMRGPYPGLGSALTAMGIMNGIFVAREIELKLKEYDDPWPIVDDVIKNPGRHLSRNVAKGIGSTQQSTWNVIINNPERIALMKLLSRFHLTKDQATTMFNDIKRKGQGINDIDDKNILENPYLLYESTRLAIEECRIPLSTLERGIFPDEIIIEKHPIPKPSDIPDGSDWRRIRAYTIRELENAADQGSTLMSTEDIINNVNGLNLKPQFLLTTDVLEGIMSNFASEIWVCYTKNNDKAYQLRRYKKISGILKRIVEKRTEGKTIEFKPDWKVLLKEELKRKGKVDLNDDQEQAAIKEKVIALEAIAASRFSVLVGPAGCGKTTLISVFCNHPEIKKNGVLLLAPTGKARVRLEDSTKMKGLTIAQFLIKYDRYDPDTGRYLMSGLPCQCDDMTVIIDESSMLTEDMLAAVIEAIKDAKRIILIGDHRQLPPIGAGKPYFDIVKYLKDKVDGDGFTKQRGYVELKVRVRQNGKARDDLRLSEWFSGEQVQPSEDDVFEKIVKGEQLQNVRFETWETPEDAVELILKVLIEELKLKGVDDYYGFDESIGGEVNKSDEYMYFNLNAVTQVDNWQILSPVRGMPYGVVLLNRLIHGTFKKEWIDKIIKKNINITKPLGPERIIYGDKIINTRNMKRKTSYPDHSDKYINNGETGIVTGNFWKKNSKRPNFIKVAFSTQKEVEYPFYENEFDEDGSPILNLAYALTVHKAQGSEFKLVILIVPRPCRILTREMIYTAITRQKEKIVILFQGEPGELKSYANDIFSETARRMTNLFENPDPVKVADKIFDNNLIHLTLKGEMVRSKSELVIANMLYSNEIRYRYEKELKIDDGTKLPDFTINDPDTGLTYYWEHLGMLKNPEYEKRWIDKLKWYKSNGILPIEEGGGENGFLIITKDDDKGGISSKEIQDMIYIIKGS